MTKFIKLVLLVFSLNIWLQYTDCKNEKDSETFVVPGIDVELSVDAIKDYFYGKPSGEDESILIKELKGWASTDEIETLANDIKTLSKENEDLSSLSKLMSSVVQILRHLDQVFLKYEYLKGTKKNASNYDVYIFVHDADNRYQGPIANIDTLYAYVIPGGASRKLRNDYSKNVLTLLLLKMKEFQRLCNQHKSQQQLYLPLLHSITNIELKVFLIMEYALRKLAEFDKVDYDRELKLLKENLKKRFEQLTSNFQNYMKKADFQIWRCDPDKYKEDKTYFKLHLFQKYLARDHELTGSTTCHYTCNYFDNVEHYRCKDRKNYENSACHSVRTCTGRLFDCQDTFSSSSEVWTCPAPQYKSRRYEFIKESSYNRKYGRNIECTKPLNYDYRSWGEGWRDCDICLCTCDDSKASMADAKINLRPVTADKDHAVIGIRWVKKDHTLHLQIKQGKVLAKGKIDSKSVAWKDIQEPRNKNDIVKFSWQGLRRIHLHDTKLADGDVVVGIKLDTAEINEKELLTFRLLNTSYQYQTGKLDYSVPFYEDPDNSVSKGAWYDRVNFTEPLSETNEAKLGKGLLPNYNDGMPSTPVEKEKTFVAFETSDLLSDIGQNTVPFFDMQENTADPPALLSGIGIYLKHAPDYCGFLSFKLISFDVSPYIADKI